MPTSSLSLIPAAVVPSPSPTLLAAAQRKLLDAQVPQLLRLTAFLRLSCAALDTPGAYSRLLQSLYQTHPEWMKTCEITGEGTLYSTEPAIQQLLAPVLQLHMLAAVLLAA